MFVRKNFWPKSVSDMVFSSLLFCFFIPFVYCYELFFVLPKYYLMWSPWYVFHWTCATFIGVNLVSNLVALVLCDTSIRGRDLSGLRDSHLCATCECMVPARSWHCPTCQTCILRRDHHCIFSGCCVGHYNLRYFLIFLLYLVMALIYAFYWNTWHLVDTGELNARSLLHLVFPLAMLLYDFSYGQLLLFLYLLLTLGMLLSGFLLYYHISLLLTGQVSHERGQGLRNYDLGPKENMKTVLGAKWYLVWLAPFVHSPPTHDGLTWTQTHAHKQE